MSDLTGAIRKGAEALTDHAPRGTRTGELIQYPCSCGESFDEYWTREHHRAEAVLRAVGFGDALALVAEQAEDEGLWFMAQTAPEAYLQQELRRLHAALEQEST